MLSATEIRNVKFSKSMSGYKQEEVDILLDKVESDYAAFERMTKDFQTKIESLSAEIEDLKASQSSIQNVLLSAQRLADKIVAEAKEQSDEIIKNAEANISVITAQERELSATFEFKAQERKAQLEKELVDMVRAAELKANSITAAAQDSVERQQVLFDKLKMEIAAFKTSITTKYKEHLEILSAIPDSVPSDPKEIAALVSAAIDKAPDAEQFISSSLEPSTFEEPHEEEVAPAKEPEPEKQMGFSVETLEDTQSIEIDY